MAHLEQHSDVGRAVDIGQAVGAIGEHPPENGRRMWDEAAEWWSIHLREDKNRLLQVFPFVLRLLGETEGSCILDAGCGEGSFARMLADKGAHVTGVDFSKLVDLAIAEECAHPRKIQYIKEDIADLRVAEMEGQFNQVVCNLVLHCCQDLDPILSAVHAGLKAGGTMVISDLHPHTFPEYSRAWTTCSSLGGNEYRYTLGNACPELRLYLHNLQELEMAFERNGFICRERHSPPAPSSRHVAPGKPQFVYYLLQK